MEPSQNKNCVLIVDDAPVNVHILREYLRDEYEIKTAECGREALDIAGSRPFPDLIVLDIMMPGMDGYEVLETLKRNPDTRDIPVIFVTSKNEEEDEAKGFECGAVDYIIKPFRPSLVKSRIKIHLELKKYRDSLEALVKERTVELESAFEDLKKLDMAREKVIDHLSHELKTPLAVLRSVFELLRNKLSENMDSRLEGALARGDRSLRKLIEIQEEIDDIIDRQDTKIRKQRILHIFEDMLCIAGELADENDQYAGVFEQVAKKIESIYQEREIRTEEIYADAFISDIIDEINPIVRKRDIAISRKFEEGCRITADRTILGKVCRGLIKNAVENTPDEGRIEIVIKKHDRAVSIHFRDFGVGITDNNQEHIFGGFFHTQDTLRYSTRQPYDFDAGGAGSDLLRIKIFSERYGFELRFASRRCGFIPSEKDICPGRISECPHVGDGSECLASGGSLFSVVFREN